MWVRKGIYLVLHVYSFVSLEGNEAALLCINKHLVLYFFRRYTPGQAAPRSRRWVLVTGGLASYWYHNDNTRNLYQHHLIPEFAWSLIGEDVCWPRFCLATMPTHQTNCPELFDLPSPQLIFLQTYPVFTPYVFSVWLFLHQSVTLCCSTCSHISTLAAMNSPPTSLRPSLVSSSHFFKFK